MTSLRLLLMYYLVPRALVIVLLALAIAALMTAAGVALDWIEAALWPLGGLFNLRHL